VAGVFPTVREVLALEPVRHGAPRVVAGEAGLDRPVRWVHAAEVPDIATLLRGGELVLTTGIGLPADDTGLRTFITELADVGIAGLVVELGRRYPAHVPSVMVAAAARRELPLVELRRPTPFVRITEAVHALIVDAQLTELRATEEIHQRFTELSVEGAEPAEVVRQAAELAACPVVLENLARQVLAYDSAGDRAALLLEGWEQHSRRIQPAGRTAYDADAGWLVTMVGARGQDWGRLLLRWPPPGEAAADATPPTRLAILLERAASTLALGRLIRRDEEGLERQIHRTLLTALLDHTRPVDEVALRARALGVALERRHLVGVVVRRRQEVAEGGLAGAAAPADSGFGGAPDMADGGVGGVPEAEARMRDLAEAVGQALREARLAGLTGPLDDQTVGVLLALRDREDEDPALSAFASALRRVRPDDRRGGRSPAPPGTDPGCLIVAAGSGVGDLREARRSLVEARQVAETAERLRKQSRWQQGLRKQSGWQQGLRKQSGWHQHDLRDVPVFRLPHMGLAGLLHLLREEPRLQTFVERQLGQLLAYDARHPRERLLETLRAYLDNGRNKSAAATAAHLSRPAFYERLARIARILDVDLDSVDTSLSLHVALLALDAIRND
jgi:PucR family transcriptional regulator, purine catabolism regulatory protein